MPPLLDYDVTVIGAGPAGSRTAALLAAEGHRVALLEQDTSPGQPVHCSGIVSRECFERYALHEATVLGSSNEFVLRSPKGRATHVERDAVQAYVLDRPSLDMLLARRAEDAGATLITSTTANDIRWVDDHVDIHVVANGQPRTIAARAAVLATGYGAPLARKLGFETSKEAISGCQYVVEATDASKVEVFTGAKLGHGGFGWLVPWRPGLALVGVLSRKHTVRLLHALVERLRKEGRIGNVQQQFRCRGIPLGVSTRSTMDGVVAVGDVIGQVKPTSGGGIYYSLLGAEAAAQTLSEALAKGSVTMDRLQPYEQRWRALMEGEINQGYKLRRLLEQIPDGVAEQLHRLLGIPGMRRIVMASAPSFDWHSAPLLSVLSVLQRRARVPSPISGGES